MTLEQYTNDRRDDAFVYWLEVRLQALGGIRGGSAFKFGVARRSDSRPRASAGGRAYDARYMWLDRYGDSPGRAFEAVRALIVDVVDAAAAGRLEVIDGIDFSPIVKWKIAFLYQPRDAALVFPLYKRECLFHHYQKSVDSEAQRTQTSYGAMYRALSLRLHRLDVFERADGLWRAWEQASEAEQRRDWLIPLSSFGIQGHVAEALCAREVVDGAELPLALRAHLKMRGLRVGDRLALLDGQAVRALGAVEVATEEALGWRQRPAALPVALPEGHGAELLEVTTWKIRDAIWGARPDEAAPDASALEPCPPPTCAIFYGPPGTGKTREALRRALAICGEALDGLDDEAVSERAAALERAGRLSLVTFHPSYGYEEFIEGIRPELGEGAELGYRCVDGVFKRMALAAASAGLIDAAARAPGFDGLWRRLVGEVREAEGDYLVESLDGQLHALTSTARGNLEARRVLSVAAEEAWVAARRHTLSREILAHLWGRRAALGPAEGLDVAAIKAAVAGLKGASSFNAALAWPVLQALGELAGRAGPPLSVDRVERARDALQRHEERAMRFGRAAPPHVLIIDEINRGNISRIMGELISLLEPSRRLGAPDAVALRLAVSQERFAVPPNLHVLGTMNTADRSIALMDVALRRRFVFEEHMPDAAVVEVALIRQGAGPPWAALVKALMETLNARICYLYDRDHQIGHATFLDATTPRALRQILVERVFPLLQEYFYDAWGSICAVLGCPYDPSGRPLRLDAHCAGHTRQGHRYKAPALVAEVLREADVLGIPHGDREDRLSFALNPELLDPDADEARLGEFAEVILSRPLPSTAP